MHSHRLRYLVFGLLIYIQNAFCRTCNSNFTDVQSRTVRSGVVFEGSVRERHETFSADKQYNATMKVKKVLKGSLPKDVESDRFKTILVGLFGPEDKEQCVYDIGVGTYIVFLDGHNSSSLDPKVPYYRISAFPEPSTPEIKKLVRKYRCEKCGKIPTARARPSLQEVQQGKRINLKCKVSGRPVPVITWRKDNKEVENKGRIRIRTSKSRKLSRLQIKHAKIEDEGIYTCVVSNALGTNYDDIEVAVSELSTSPVPHAIPCPEENGHNYCLNGGKCYKVEYLGNRFCRCADGFTGHRCRDRDIFGILQEEELTEAKNLDRALTISGLVIAGVVLGILILAAYILSRKKRQNYRKRQEEKREKAVLKNAENGTYCAVPLESAKIPEKNFNKKTLMLNEATQTEEMMNAPFLGIAAVERAATMSAPRGHHPHGPNLPRQQTSPSLLASPSNHPQLSEQPHPGASQNEISHNGGLFPEGRLSSRGRLSGVSVTPEPDDPKHSNAAVINAVVESDPEMQSSSKRSSPSQSSRTESAHAPIPNKLYYGEGQDEEPGLDLDLDARSDYDNQPPSDMSVQMESGSDLPGGTGDDPMTTSHRLSQLSSQPTDDLELQSTDTDTDESSSISEERAIFRNLQTNPRVRSLQHIDNLGGPDPTGNLSWDQWDTTASARHYNKPYSAFNPYALDNDILVNRHCFHGHGRGPPRASRRRHSTDDYVELPYDPDPDATVV